jgi:hypothetical protein
MVERHQVAQAVASSAKAWVWLIDDATARHSKQDRFQAVFLLRLRVRTHPTIRSRHQRLRQSKKPRFRIALSRSPMEAPHSGFSKLILRIRSRSSLPIRGRPDSQQQAPSRRQISNSIDALLTAKSTYLNRNRRSLIRDRQIRGGACSLGAPHIHVAQRRMWL